MTKKQFIAAIMLLFLPVILSGCLRKEAPVSQDQQVKGEYTYTAKDLGFGLTLPETFQYYQTQRKNLGDHTDLEIYVPTSDTSYEQLVPGYARVIIVRVADKNLDYKDAGRFQLVGENDKSKFWIEFWKTPSKDWTDRWSEVVKKQIIDSFKKIS